MNSTTDTINDAGTSLTPFQRNRYFYGKLMMVRDFLAEQVYMNRKRHLINRMVDGWGIVCGLGVTSSGASITVSPGVAIDCCGREIVVDQQVTVQISTLNGYPTTAPTTPTAFDLCLAYSECLQEPVSALANASTCEESCEYNRIQETYQLSLRPSIPPSSGNPLNSTVTIYSDSTGNTVKIQRIAPQWVNTGQLFAITLQVTLLSAASNLKVQITENLPASLKMVQGLSAQNVATINCNGSAGSVVSLVYWAQPAGATGAVIVSASAIQVGDASPTPSDPGSKIQVISGPVIDQLVASYFSNTLTSCPTCATTDAIVLATFTVNSSGNITGASPPTQFVYDNLLLYYLLSYQANDPRLSDPRTPLPHAATHEAGGSDVINVNNLSGVLSQPQNVQALLNGAAVAARTRMNFTGGVTVTDDAANNWALINVSGGSTAPAATTGTVANTNGTVTVNSGLGSTPFSVVLGTEDATGTAQYPLTLPTGVSVVAQVPASATPPGSFQIVISGVTEAPGAVNIRWCAIPAVVEIPTLTLPTPTLTLPTHTITIPTLTLPTGTVPTITHPTFTITETHPTFTLPTHTIFETLHPTAPVLHPAVATAVASSPVVSGPLGDIPTGPEGAAGPSIIVPQPGGNE